MTRESRWCFGEFRFDGRLLFRGSKRLDATEREAQVLELLLERRPHRVLRDELLRFYPRVEPNSLDKGISNLRTAMDDTGRGTGRRRRYVYIDTVQGEGYAFVYEPVRKELSLNAIYEVGLDRWNCRDARSVWEAKRCFDQILRRDPQHGPAYAARADCFPVLGSYGGLTPREGAIKGKAAAKQALRIDAGLYQPYATLAFVQSLFERKWQAATRDFERSIHKRKDYGTAHHWYGLHLAATGDLLRAIEQISIARECDPLSPIIETHTAAILYWARLFDLAAEQCNRAIEAEHSQFWYMHHLLGLVYEQRGQMEEAREEQQTAAKLYDEAQEQNASAEGSARARSALVGAALARAHALCGDRGKAAQELGNLRARGTRAAALYHTATAYTALGDVDAAFAHLRSACNQGDVWASFLAVDPRLDALRGDRRLSSLQRELDLPAAAARSPELSRKDITMVRRWLEL